MMDVDERDRDLMMFLLWEDPAEKTMRIFRHKRVVFGVNSSPFLPAAVIQNHLKGVSDEEKAVARKLSKSLYLDNCNVDGHI
jgi:hypothetical protein